MDHTLPGPLALVAIGLCLSAVVVAVLDLRAGVTERSLYAGRTTELAHVVMLLAMAAMWTPAGDALSATFWRVVFGVLALAMSAWVVIALGGADDVGAAVYHWVAAVAMVYATFGGHHHHAHHGSAAGHLPVPLLGWAFCTLFAIDAVVTAGALGWQLLRRRRARPLFAHLVMDVAMVVMLGQALTTA